MSNSSPLTQLGGRHYDGGVGSNWALSLTDVLLSGEHPLLLSLEFRALPHRYQFKIFVAFFCVLTDSRSIKTGNSGAQCSRAMQGLPHHSLPGAEQDVLEAD